MEPVVSQQNKQAALFDPPGGVLIWIVVILEVLTFAVALIGLAWFSQSEPEIYSAASRSLNTKLGFINTVVLLTSGFFVAMAVHGFKHHPESKPQKMLVLAILGGAVFVLLKSYEYHEKLGAGIGLYENMFYTFYWLLTGFHLLHVLTGMVILIVVFRSMKTQKARLEDVEAAGTFWHMCDLIWLLLFPSLYLIM